MNPVIVEVAINGVVTKEKNNNVPIGSVEMARSIDACLGVGATVVHAHAGDPYVGTVRRHDSGPYIEAFGNVLRERPDAILYPTLPAGPILAMPERYAHIVELADAGMLKMAPIDPGTMNWGSFRPDGSDENAVYQNTFADVRYAFDFCVRRGLGCTMSIFEPGFLQIVLAHKRAGTLPKGSVVKLEFSGGKLLFGPRANTAGLQAYLSMLEGTDIPWMVNYRDGDLSDGFGLEVLRLGGHVRVGIEDYGGSGAPRNEELVLQALELARRVGRRAATQQEAACLLGLD